MPNTKNDARLYIRLPAKFKTLIEDAALELGLTVSDFAISTLVESSQQILQHRDVTRLSERDRQELFNILDDESTKPNPELRRAAQRYRKQIR